MKRITKVMTLLLVAVLSLTVLQPFSVEATTIYVRGKRTVEPTVIYQDGEAEVKLTITGTPPIGVVKPSDVVLILDKSGSMAEDNRFQAMIDSAKEFVNLFDFSAHQVGIVDYSFGNLTNSYPLSTNEVGIKQYLDTISLYGGTDTHIAIRKAMEVLATGRENTQPVIVLLTDGEANDEEAAKRAAKEAKEAGIVFYTIALLAPNEDPTSSAANELMKEMATTAQHHHFVLGSVGLLDIYKAIVDEIGIASAYNVKVTEKVNPKLEIVPGSYEHNIPKPSVDGNVLTWEMAEIKDEALELSYKIKLRDGEKPGKYSIAPGSEITYTDYTGASRRFGIPNIDIIIKYNNLAPTIVEITPDRGGILGGDFVTIKGENFREGVSVKFGENLATNVQVVDENTITLVTPEGVQGDCEVIVTNDDGQLVKTKYKYIVNPIVTSINPNQGDFQGGNQIKIEGQYFLSGMNGMKVYIGNKAARVLNNTGSSVTVEVPVAERIGKVDVKLENPDGTFVIIQDGYEYLEGEQPQIDIINPNSGMVNIRSTAYIEGQGFAKGLKVTIGGQDAEVLNYYSSTRIRVQVPASAQAGKVDVVLTHIDGKEDVLIDGYEYLPEIEEVLEIVKISLSSTVSAEGINSANKGQIVYMHGNGFEKSSKVKVVDTTGEEFLITPANVYDSKRIRFKLPANVESGSITISVVNEDRESDSIAFIIN